MFREGILFVKVLRWASAFPAFQFLLSVSRLAREVL
jgi:hypothetical protein